MCFYGAIEQLLTGWIFEVLPPTDEEYEQAKGLCGRGHLRRPREGGPGGARRRLLESGAVNHDISKRLMWSGLLAGLGAITSIVATKVAAAIWIRIFKEDPPID